MYQSMLCQYIDSYAKDGITIEAVDIWGDCEIGDETELAKSLGIKISRGQTEPIWEFYAGGQLVGRCNLGRP